MIKKILSGFRKGYVQEMYKEILWMYRYVKKYRKSVFFYMLAGMFGIFMSLGSSVASKYLIDTVTGARKNNYIGLLILIIACMTILNIVCSALISRISAKINVVVQNEIQADIFNKIIFTDWEALNRFRNGDLLNRLTTDTSQVSSSVIGWIPGTITKLVQFVGTFAIIFYYDPVMAGIALLGAPVTAVLSRQLMKKMRIYNIEMREMTSDLMAFQDDTFQNLQSVKAFGLMSLFGEKLKCKQQAYKDKMMDYNKFTVYTSSLMSAIGTGMSYICFGWSVYRLWSGYITTGTLLMFLQMANSLTSSFSSLVQMVPSAINAATCAGRLMAVSGMKQEYIPDSQEIRSVKKNSSCGLTVKISHIDVGYKDGNSVICNGSFAAVKGKVTAIIGPSGEGKTTLIRILLGLIHPLSGTAELVCGNGSRCGLSAATRELFGYVPQGNTIFAGTIAENMRMIKCDASDEEIIQALKTACAYDFVKRLPKGIYTFIGEKGNGLSEGQAQRIAIARAILKDAPILVLDEATSALDTETEERVLRNIMKPGNNKTCIVTTHRSSVLSVSDFVYEIRDNHLNQVK